MGTNRRSGRTRSWIGTALLAAGSLVASGAAATPPPIEAQQQVATGSMPKGVILSPDGTRLYVTNYGQLDRNNISIVDAATLDVIDRIDVPGIVVEAAIAPDGRTLYVSNFRRNSVQFIDLASHAVTREVHVGLHPKILVLSHDGRRLFAANWGSRDVTEVDAATGNVVRTLPAQDNPRGMAITRDGRLYIANFNSRSIDVYDGPAMEHHHRLENVCRVPRHLALSPDEHSLYITCFTDSWLAVMDTSTERITHRVPVGRSPKADDVTPDGRYVVTADYGGSSVSVVDTRDWTSRTVDVPGMDSASGIAIARTGMRVFVTGWYDDHLYSVGLAGTAARYAVDRATLTRIHASREAHRTHGAE